MRENTKHRTAFSKYLELGPERSLENLYELLSANPGAYGFNSSPSRRSLARWSGEFHWQERLADLEREARRHEGEAYVRALVEMNERQAREGLLLQQKGVQRFQILADDELSPTEAIRALSEGARLERLARGEVTDRTQIERNEDIELAGFSLAELKAIAELALIQLRRDGKA